MLIKLIDFVLHIDQHLAALSNEYNILAYAVIFGIIFLETGIVVAPILPGDSLLFAAGALAAAGFFRIEILFVLIFAAAVLGDTVNYQVGKYVGPKVFNQDSSRLFQRAHLLRAQNFYEKHGKKTIILARFMPIIRTFAPFVAGIGVMDYSTFIFYNIIGALAWTSLFVFSGYIFGNIPLVQENFGLLVIVIILISVTPFIKEFIAYYWQKKNSPPNKA